MKPALLTVAVSSRSLFCLEKENEVFETQGAQPYDELMWRNRHQPLEPGVAFDLVRKLLRLNQFANDDERFVNVVMLSRNSHQAGNRILHSIKSHGLDIDDWIFTEGGNNFLHAQDMGADLFLSANESDVKAALANRLAAGLILPSAMSRLSTLTSDPDEAVRLAFDLDSVVFDDEADKVFRAKGLPGFYDHEREKAHIPLDGGPFRQVLEKLLKLQRLLAERNPEMPKQLFVGYVTARIGDARQRAMTTLQNWNMQFDYQGHTGDDPKGPRLREFRATFFWDDTGRHVESAVEHGIPAAHVAIGAGGIPPANPALRALDAIREEEARAAVARRAVPAPGR